MIPCNLCQPAWLQHTKIVWALGQGIYLGLQNKLRFQTKQFFAWISESFILSRTTLNNAKVHIYSFSDASNACCHTWILPWAIVIATEMWTEEATRVIMVKQLSKFIAWDIHYFPCVRYVSVHSVHRGQGEDSHKDRPQDQWMVGVCSRVVCEKWDCNLVGVIADLWPDAL